MLVFPGVFKAGIGTGGEYGKRVLGIDGKTVDYYNTMAASIGFQPGARKKIVILVLVADDALKKSRDSSGWEAGVEGSMAFVELGARGSIDTTNIKGPIVGFVVSQKGLMYNLTLEGSEYTKTKN